MLFDVLLVLSIFIGFYFGFSKGIVRTVAILLGLILGMVVAVKMTPTVTRMLSEMLNGPGFDQFLPIAAFFLTFLLTVWILHLFASVIEGFLQKIGLNYFNQFLGGALMAVVTILLYSSIVSFMEKANLITAENTRDSYTYAYVQEIPEVTSIIAQESQPIIEEFWATILNAFEDNKNNSETYSPQKSTQPANAPPQDTDN